MYTVIDAMDKQIEMKKILIKKYESLLEIDESDEGTKTILKILVKEKERQLKWSIKRKKEMSAASMHLDVDLDFVSYDSLSKKALKWKSRIDMQPFNRGDLIIPYALDIEESGLAILMAVRNLIMENPQGLGKDVEPLVDEMIEVKMKQIENLKLFQR